MRTGRAQALPERVPPHLDLRLTAADAGAAVCFMKQSLMTLNREPLATGLFMGDKLREAHRRLKKKTPKCFIPRRWDYSIGGDR